MATATLDKPTATFDEAAAESFMEHIAGVLDAGALAIMISIGHRSGLFDRMAGMGPASSRKIAEAAGLKERYVREWLAATVTGRVVTFDPAADTYHLPAEHAACLTRASAPNNLAVYAQMVAMTGVMQDRVLELMKNGGGTSYDDYPCFHRMMSEDSAQTVVSCLFDSILPLAPDLRGRLARGIDVLDAGCSRGLALLAMAEHFPASRFVGYDLCPDAIAFAKEEAARRGLANIRFDQRDLTGYDEPEAFDLICSFDAVHDQKDPQALLSSLHRALRRQGIYLMQDIGASARLENNLDFPMATMLYAVSLMHCMPISIGQGGAGLGTMWGHETASAMLEGTGFAEITAHHLPHDPMNVWFVSRKSSLPSAG